MRAAVAGLRGSVSFQAPLREYTSFKIGGPADVVVEPADIEDVCLVVQQARARKIPLFVLGGTNLLIRDGGIRGIVVSLVRLRAIKEEPGSVLYAEGGVGMPTLIGYAIRHSLAGLEWAAGIPGTVAGCVVMNAGTKLGEMKDSVKAVRMVEYERPGRGRGSSPGEVRVSTGLAATRHRRGGMGSVEARGPIGD